MLARGILVRTGVAGRSAAVTGGSDMTIAMRRTARLLLGTHTGLHMACQRSTARQYLGRGTGVTLQKQGQDEKG